MKDKVWSYEKHQDNQEVCLFFEVQVKSSETSSHLKADCTEGCSKGYPHSRVCIKLPALEGWQKATRPKGCSKSWLYCECSKSYLYKRVFPNLNILEDVQEATWTEGCSGSYLHLRFYKKLPALEGGPKATCTEWCKRSYLYWKVFRETCTDGCPNSSRTWCNRSSKI